MVALVLGSRVSADSGHITQLCVRPRYRRLGLARTLLAHGVAPGFVLPGHEARVSLTVTEANQRAIEFISRKALRLLLATFDAAVWHARG